METAKSAAEKPAANPATECRQVANGEILQPGDTGNLAASLKDEELLVRVKKTFHNLRDNLPFLREAHHRFAKPGCRLPVPGSPTWTEWVTTNLGKSLRTVQRLLAENKPKPEKKLRAVKALKDWREAQRKINDFHRAVTKLKAKVPRGVDVLIPALHELAALAGYQLIQSQAAAQSQPAPSAEPVARANARAEEQKRQKELRKAQDTERDRKRIAQAKAAQKAEAEARPRQRAAKAATDAIAAKFGFDTESLATTEHQ